MFELEQVGGGGLSQLTPAQPEVPPDEPESAAPVDPVDPLGPLDPLDALLVPVPESLEPVELADEAPVDPDALVDALAEPELVAPLEPPTSTVWSHPATSAASAQSRATLDEVFISAPGLPWYWSEPRAFITAPFQREPQPIDGERVCYAVAAMHALLAFAMLAISAAPPRVQLAYDAPAEAGCPDQTWFRQAVAARVGRDPFDAAAELQISARIRSAPPWMEGTVELSRGGKRMGLRHFRSRECRELATDMVVAVSIAIDPQSFSQPAPPPPPPPLPSPSAPPPAPPAKVVVVAAAPPARPPSPPLHLRLGLGALASGGISPYPTAGAELRAELRGETFGVRLELEADLPRSVDVPPGQVTSEALRATLAPCLHRGGLGVCAELSGALLLVTGQVVEPSQRKSAGLAMLGASVEYAFALGAGLHLAPFLRLQAVVPRTTVLSGAQPDWVTAPVAGALGVLLDVQIL